MKKDAAIAFAALLALSIAAACGHSTGGADSVSSKETTDGGGSHDGSKLGSMTSTPDASVLFGSDAGATDAPVGPLTIAPLNPTVTLTTGQPIPTVAFTASLGGQPTMATWSIDRGELGAIDASGVFTPSGKVSGAGTITAQFGSQMTTTMVTVTLVTMQMGDPAYSPTGTDAGAGGYGGVGGGGPGAPPTATQVTTLNSAPTADPNVQILYPYDGTVWPQGLLAPLVQWYPGTHAFDSVYIDIKEKNYEYKGYFAANATPFINVPIPQAAWSTMAFSNAGEPVVVTMIFGSGATAYGPYTETWTIAPATLQGTIYYNSYGTSLVKNSATDGLDSYGDQYGAGTLGILPGATAPTLIAGINTPNASGDGTGCRVCHTVSANGQSLVTQASNVSAGNYSDTVYIDLSNDPTMGAGTSLATSSLAFPALYRDGSLLLSGSGGMIWGDSQSTLYSLPAGTPVPNVTGLPAGLQASLPAFSPDGSHVSFNFWKGTMTSSSGATLTGDQVSLAMMDFDASTSTFSNSRVLYTPPGGTPGGDPSVTYSSFFPGGQGIVFEVELSRPSGNWGFTWSGNTSELWWLDVASGMAHRLDSLNGYSSGGNPYLPNNAMGAATHTSTQDVQLNFEPTVNPVASGGYAWVVFTSRRMYGNVAQLDPWTSDPRHYPWKDQVTDKKLWVAAIDLNAAPGQDPSHPAFYLPAQELLAGNSRGFWTVIACKNDGSSCQAGDECCGGYCQGGADGGAGQSLVCTSQKPACSGQYDKCTATSDCCGAAQGITCVNGLCTQSQPQTPQ